MPSRSGVEPPCRAIAALPHTDATTGASTTQMSDLKPSGEPQDAHENVYPIIHNLQFGYNAEISKVATSEFLEHSKHVVQIIEKMGKMFAPLKYDMNGNINKITTTYLKNEEAHHYLEDMVLIEQADGGGITIDALQWLRRLIMCRFAPTRKELYKILSSGHTHTKEHIVEEMRLFKTNLLACINHLVTFYHDNNLENEAVV
ncbi:glycolipid transfer protein-related [Holotrichia oblita]|uniref:Glycolipid transfer protein-related n=1 Tax=Holotrichia oblita TaxID=644536 RepID=A0ACB9T4C1_HOLOL|nr:glycolipid transfer protein-related [Holotrichia oblita]